MTAPYDNGDDYGPAQQPNYLPPPPTYPPPPPGYVAPPTAYPPPVGQYPGGYGPAAVPWGYHPVTGEQLSDKSKTVAGLLQLLGIIGVLGVGRMYMGQVSFGVAQLVGCLILGAVTCGIGFFVPVVWGIIDAIVLMTGTPRDAYGRLLRDGP
jgi:TM2 domain-containing membrane protein YozV